MERLAFKKLVIIDDGGCWIWKRSVRGGSYAQCSHKDEPTRMASHLAYKLFKGEVGTAHVLHTCDVPRCVNPRHLFLGTPADNTHDMMRKGRLGKHPPGRGYNTSQARKNLAAKYKDPVWVKQQGDRIRAGFAAKRDREALLQSGWGSHLRLLGLDQRTQKLVESY